MWRRTKGRGPESGDCSGAWWAGRPQERRGGSTVPLVRDSRRDGGEEAPGRRRTRSTRHAWTPRRDGSVPGAGVGERRHLPLPTICRRLAGIGALGTRRGLDLDTHRPGEGARAHPTRPTTGGATRERDAEQEDEFALAIQIAAVRFAARTAVSRFVYDVAHCRTSRRLPCWPPGGWLRRWLRFAHPHGSGRQRARGNWYSGYTLPSRRRRSPAALHLRGSGAARWGTRRATVPGGGRPPGAEARWRRRVAASPLASRHPTKRRTGAGASSSGGVSALITVVGMKRRVGIRRPTPVQ